MMFVSSRLKTIFLLLLCLCLVLTGCQGGTVHVHMDDDSGPGRNKVMGYFWISRGIASVIHDVAVSEDAILPVRSGIMVRDENGSVQGFWEGLGFTCVSPVPDETENPYFTYMVEGTKAQWNRLLTAEEMSGARASITRGRREKEGVLTLWLPEGYTHGVHERAYPGVLLYAEHPEKFIDPPTVSYLVNYQFCYTNAQNIPALLEREEVSQIQFVGHYMVKE